MGCTGGAKGACKTFWLTAASVQSRGRNTDEEYVNHVYSMLLNSPGRAAGAPRTSVGMDGFAPPMNTILNDMFPKPFSHQNFGIIQRERNYLTVDSKSFMCARIKCINNLISSSNTQNLIKYETIDNFLLIYRILKINANELFSCLGSFKKKKRTQEKLLANIVICTFYKIIFLVYHVISIIESTVIWTTFFLWWHTRQLCHLLFKRCWWEH